MLCLHEMNRCILQRNGKNKARPTDAIMLAENAQSLVCIGFLKPQVKIFLKPRAVVKRTKRDVELRLTSEGKRAIVHRLFQSKGLIIQTHQ